PQSQVQKRNPVPNQPSLLALQMMAPLPRAALLSFWFVFTSLATKSSRISGGSTVFQAKNPSRVQKQRPSGSPTRLLQRQRTNSMPSTNRSCLVVRCLVGPDITIQIGLLHLAA